MALDTFSAFNFGHVVTDANKFINFNEGSGELSASIAIGDFTLGEYAVAVATAMNTVAVVNVYTVTVNRPGETLTIVGDTGAFDLLISSGSQVASGAFTLMGFTGADLTGLLTYTGERSGTQFRPQTKLNDYTPKENFKDFIQPTVNESASGVLEVVSFGRREFIEFSLPFITDIVPQDGKVIKSSTTGVADTNEFLEAITEKTKFEFVPSVLSAGTFIKVVLEKTAENNDGTGYKLRERIADNLPGYFRSGLITLRVIT